MCAINGFNFKDEALIAKMNLATKHRGPDGSGVFCDSDISLGHDRLSIIDLSSAAGQPMTSGSGRYTIVFNGEIYNYRELKKELGDYPFKTASDTEVILAAYEKWGEGCVNKFNGIFAFAIWDLRECALFLARDPIGVKPLYYFWDGKKFIFSSEIKGILEHDVPRFIDHEALSIYFRALYVPEPLTMFRGIKKLPAGATAVLRGGNLKIFEKRLERSPEKLKIDLREAATETRRVIRQAVERQLVSDRPLGIYLSGGIDSSVILDLVADRRGNIDTFSVGFDLTAAEERDKFNRDFELARRTAAHYGTRHNEVLISSEEAAENLERAIRHLDEPIANPTILPMMILSGFAKQKAAVVLGGDGGDELFGGYERYRLSLIAGNYQKFVPSVLRRLLARSGRLAKLNVSAGIERYALFMFQKDRELSGVLNRNFIDDAAKKYFAERFFGTDDPRPFEERFMEADRRSWLADESLMMTDKMSMSAGLEARVPFLDLEVVRFADSLPLEYKVSPFKTKIVLKEAFRGRIPEFLFDQPKRGWFSPAAKWLRRPEMLTLARAALSKEFYAETKDVFDWNGLNVMLERHLSGKEYALTPLWSALVFQIWAKQYKVKL